MNIAEIKQIQDGTKVYVSGFLESSKPAKNLTGTSPNCIKPDNPAGNYSFWVQDIVIYDSTDRITVGVGINDDTFAFHDGMNKTPVTIEGLVHSYTGKFGLTKDITRAKVKSATAAAPAPIPQLAQAPPPPTAGRQLANHFGGQQGMPTEQHPGQAPPIAPQSTQPDWDAIARGKVRSLLVCAVLQTGAQPDCSYLASLMPFIFDGTLPGGGDNPDYDPNPATPTDNIPF